MFNLSVCFPEFPLVLDPRGIDWEGRWAVLVRNLGPTMAVVYWVNVSESSSASSSGLIVPDKRAVKR